MKKLLVYLLVLMICVTMAVPAMAASVFLFTEKNITIYEGETFATALRREGIYEEAGEITYTSSRPAVATVDADGTITAVSKGFAEITATMKRDGKRVGNQATAQVKVMRAVTKVTLNTTRLAVYDPDDPAVADLLWEPPMTQVLVIPAGTTVNLAATCTPEDASSVKVSFTSSDAGVAKVSGTSMRAVQRGECDLTVASVQNPEVTETFRVLVIQPVKKITIDAGDRKVAAGSAIKLTANCTPENASIKGVTWSSRNTAVAAVDENGVVTGLKKGTATITATAADGSKVVGTVMINVIQSVESVTITQSEIPVIVGRTAQAKATVLPAAANDRTLTWTSSDESIATVKNGVITGKKAGRCTITCRSNSNPEVYGTATAVVSQLVTSVVNVNDASELSLLVGQTVQTRWMALPEDATNKALTFKSQGTKIATVDQNGLVTATGRGTVTILATAQDASKRQGSVKVNVIQPVTGVEFKKALYYVQRGRSTTLRAVIQPSNANNQKVYWSSDNEWIASARSNGTSTGQITGNAVGVAMITATTEDGGFTATTQVRVGNFNEAVMIENLYVDDGNNIRIVLRNMSQDIVLENIHYRIELYDTQGNPMICNTDGVSTSFEGDYPFEVLPLERTSHGAFRFKNYAINQKIGKVALTVLSWKDNNEVTWNIPEEYQVRFEIVNEYNPVPQQNTDANQGEGVG